MQNAPERMNDKGTCSPSDTPLAQGRSGPVLYELVSYRGEIFGPFPSVQRAAMFAAVRWPGQDQDEERIGAGWDIEAIR